MKKHPLNSSARHLHVSRIACMLTLLAALLLVRGDTIHSPASSTNTTHNVLAYATSMSRDALLSVTNSYRAQNGLANLTLNNQLNSSAQMKAQDMLSKDYWAHVAPDGTQPWYWFSSAGYSYMNAGENLAYGFDNGSDVINGWINSATHRANLLGDYKDVGFGFVDGSNYQGGQFTIVVAHYGSPYTVPTPAPVAVTTPAQTTPTPVAVTTQPTSETPVATATETPVAEAAPATENAPTEPTPDTSTPAVAVSSEKTVSFLDNLKSGNLGTMGIVVGALTTLGIAGFGITHLALARHTFMLGEQFIVHHPLIDTTAAATVVGLILATRVGMLG